MIVKLIPRKILFVMLSPTEVSYTCCCVESIPSTASKSNCLFELRLLAIREVEMEEGLRAAAAFLEGGGKEEGVAMEEACGRKLSSWDEGELFEGRNLVRRMFLGEIVFSSSPCDSGERLS